MNGGLPSNKSLQRTFDPRPIFATAKTVVSSNAAELRRWLPLLAALVSATGT